MRLPILVINSRPNSHSIWYRFGVITSYYRWGHRRYCNYSACDFDFWGFSPHRGDTIRGLARNLAFSTVPNFPLIREYLGVSSPKNEKSPKFPTFSLTAANPLPNVDEIRRVYAGNRSTKAINNWCDAVTKLGIYRQKPQWGIFPKNFRSPLAPKLLVGLKKIKGVQKWYGHPLSSCKVWWRSPTARRR